MQQWFTAFLPGAPRASHFGLLGASQFEKAVRGVIALHRLSAPSGVAKGDFNLYGQLCPSGFLHTPSSGARRATKV